MVLARCPPQSPPTGVFQGSKDIQSIVREEVDQSRRKWGRKVQHYSHAVAGSRPVDLNDNAERGRLIGAEVSCPLYCPHVPSHSPPFPAGVLQLRLRRVRVDAVLPGTPCVLPVQAVRQGVRTDML